MFTKPSTKTILIVTASVLGLTGLYFLGNSSFMQDDILKKREPALKLEPFTIDDILNKDISVSSYVRENIEAKIKPEGECITSYSPKNTLNPAKLAEFYENEHKKHQNENEAILTKSLHDLEKSRAVLIRIKALSERVNSGESVTKDMAAECVSIGDEFRKCIETIKDNVLNGFLVIQRSIEAKVNNINDIYALDNNGISVKIVQGKNKRLEVVLDTEIKTTIDLFTEWLTSFKRQIDNLKRLVHFEKELHPFFKNSRKEKL